MKFKIKYFFYSVLIIIFLCIAYGYWYSSNHASLFFVLKDFNGLAQKKQVDLLDHEGHLLANGQSDSLYGVVYLKNPKFGFCHHPEDNFPTSEDEKNKWSQCNLYESKWLVSWINKADSALIHGTICEDKPIQIRLIRHTADWWTWWLPIPHNSGMPSSNYSISLDPEWVRKCF